MPQITDPTEIRAILETERCWAVYALGDLAPKHFKYATWFRPPGEAKALALLYRAFAVPVLLTVGVRQDLYPLLEEISKEPELYLSVRPDGLSLIEERYTVCPKKPMWRMILDPTRYQPAFHEGTVRLGSADFQAVQHLYADGESTGQAPDFFSPEMLSEGAFYGIWEAKDLIAAAGTHLVVPAEGVAAIGNIYTRRDRRGRGLARRVTSAVTAELLHQKLPTIALNVSQQNHAAIRVYERLGFAVYCAFYEGVATRWQG
jgi:ribosomal protein S18 acetylase RimI-like enzyme